MPLPLKILVLEKLLKESLNRIEASIYIGDTAINSTVSALHTLHGIKFIKWKEPYKNRWGEKVPLTRYQVDPHSIKQAEAVIRHYKKEKPSEA